MQRRKQQRLDTERQKNTDANHANEIQSIRVSENQRNRVSEKTINSDTHAGEVMDDPPPLAACIRTLPEAVQISLTSGIGPNSLFIFARCIKAFEITVGIKLTPKELDGAFATWWSTAKPQLPCDADFDEWRFIFQEAFARVRAPHGANPLHEAIIMVDSLPLPTEATQYASIKLQRLVGLCYHLQILAIDAPFFLSVRDTAEFIGTKNLHFASAMLAGLVRDGILIEIEKGVPGGKRATRFRYNRLPKPPPQPPLTGLNFLDH